ncbi:MAG: hypothetical protein KGD63_06660 [Candidatus Lokiarchaeota archaeon]|nr:hypothetical protein [Candidatus Lokiarchaeota archaeon]
MLKSINCDPVWQESEIKNTIKKIIEVLLNNLREQRVFSLGEVTKFKDLTPNEFQITAGNLFKGLVKIEKESSERNSVKINYDESVYINKSIWEGLIEKIEKELTNPLD